MRHLTIHILFMLTTLMSLAVGCGGAGSSHSGIDSPIVQGTESSIGGGNAVVCFKDQNIADNVKAAHGNLADKYVENIESVEMLDLYHAKQVRDRNHPTTPELIPIAKDESPDQYVQRIIHRFHDIIPQLAQDIQNGSRQFTESSFHYSPHGIARVDDAKSEDLLPENCTLVTMAGQAKMGDEGELTIDSRIYGIEAHSKLSRAVLLLHEYLYLIARKQGSATDSKGVRNTISFLIVKSPKFKLSEVLNALNSMIPSADHPFKSAPQQWIENTVNKLVARLIVDTYPDYQQAHPEDQALIRHAGELLLKARQSCLSHTPMGCLFPLMRMSDELLQDLPQSEFLETEQALTSAVKREYEALEKTVYAEWNASNAADEIQSASWLAQSDKKHWEQVIRAELLKDVANIPMFIIYEFNGQKPYVQLRQPEPWKDVAKLWISALQPADIVIE